MVNKKKGVFKSLELDPDLLEVLRLLVKYTKYFEDNPKALHNKPKLRKLVRTVKVWNKHHRIFKK